MLKVVEDMFWIENGYWLVLILEVSLLNLVCEIIFEEEELFLWFIVYIFCFWFEVGVVGKDIRGMIC